MFRRTRTAAALRGRLTRFPAVTVLGPRQCGKTTLVRQALPGWTYVDLERPADVAPLAADPEGRLRQLGDRVVFDEAQRLPALFPILRSLIDERRDGNGRFVLLGSASPALVREISETLAGRTALLDLPALRWHEVAAARSSGNLNALWLRGGFPRAFLSRTDEARSEWIDAYTRTFIERDLPALGIDVSASQMRRLWTMLAHTHGGLWNASQLAASLGVSYHTVNRYVDILEQTFLIRKLEPYHANISKRLVKSPKVYIRDSGLLHYFLGIGSGRELDVHPARGPSWEGFVIDQLLSAFELMIPGSRPYFWRTAKGDEVDLVIDRGTRRIPIEIKLHSTPGAAEAAACRRCMEDLNLPRGYLVYPGDRDYSLGGNVMALGAAALLRRVERVKNL